MDKNKINSFYDLNAWKIGHKVVLNIYGCTKSFPKEEMFGLTSQLRRASVSVTSNIAEGFGRRTKKDKQQLYYQANGSLMEIKSQLLVARDLGYLEKEKFKEIFVLANQCQTLLGGLIKSSFTRV